MFALQVNSETTNKSPAEGGFGLRSEQSGWLFGMHILAVI